MVYFKGTACCLSLLPRVFSWNASEIVASVLELVDSFPRRYSHFLHHVHHASYNLISLHMAEKWKWTKLQSQFKNLLLIAQRRFLSFINAYFIDSVHPWSTSVLWLYTEEALLILKIFTSLPCLHCCSCCREMGVKFSHRNECSRLASASSSPPWTTPQAAVVWTTNYLIVYYQYQAVPNDKFLNCLCGRALVWVHGTSIVRLPPWWITFTPFYRLCP